MENATAENTQKYTKEKNDLMRAFKLGYWKGYESGKKAGFAFYAGFLETIKEMGAFANAPEKLASFEASKAAITKEFADFKYAEEADYKEGAKKAADYELGIKTANSLKAQGLEVPDTLLLPNLEIVSKSVADGRKFGTLLWKNPYLLIRGLPTMETEAGDATKEVAPIADHIPTDKATAEKLVAQDLKKMYSDKYVYFQMKALADAKAAANVSPVIKRAQENVKNISGRYKAYIEYQTNKKPDDAVTGKEPSAVNFSEVIQCVTTLLSVAHFEANDPRLVAYNKAREEAKNQAETSQKQIDLVLKIQELTEPAKTEATEIDANAAIKPEDLAALKAKLAEKEQEAVEQDRKDFELGYLEALEQAKTGKDADGKNTDDEAVEKIAENLGYMSGFVAKLAELGEAGDKNKSNRLIQDFVDNLKDDVLYDKDAWTAASTDYKNMVDNDKNFKLPAVNDAVSDSPLFYKGREKGFAEGKTDGFTSYQIYAVGNSKLKTDVKMEEEINKPKFVTKFFADETKANNFANLYRNIFGNKFVQSTIANLTKVSDMDASAFFESSPFKNYNETFFKNGFKNEGKKPTAEPDPKVKDTQFSFEGAGGSIKYKEPGVINMDFTEYSGVPLDFSVSKDKKINSIGLNKEAPLKESLPIQFLSVGKEGGSFLAASGLEILPEKKSVTLFQPKIVLPSLMAQFKQSLPKKEREEAEQMRELNGIKITNKNFDTAIKKARNKFILLVNKYPNPADPNQEKQATPLPKEEKLPVIKNNIPNPEASGENIVGE